MNFIEVFWTLSYFWFSYSPLNSLLIHCRTWFHCWFTEELVFITTTHLKCHLHSKIFIASPSLYSDTLVLELSLIYTLAWILHCNFLFTPQFLHGNKNFLKAKTMIYSGLYVWYVAPNWKHDIFVTWCCLAHYKTDAKYVYNLFNLLVFLLSTLELILSNLVSDSYINSGLWIPHLFLPPSKCCD